jgi:cholest-4-en-3-one 26-monooxygenase
LVRSSLDGNPLSFSEMASYFLLLVVAGNETTRNATSGGLLAFIENPHQWILLKHNPRLLLSAVEEILRWTSPLIQFARTPVQDYQLRGQRIRAGNSLALFYPPQPTATRTFSRSRSGLTFPAIPTSTSPLGLASTSAWAPI